MLEVTSSPIWPSPRVRPRRARASGLVGCVVQRHAQAVELELGGVLDGQIAGQLAHAAVPVGQLFGGVGVVEREHGPRVAHFLEALGGLAAHALGGRVGREQLGMRGFEALELVHQRVVLGVGDFGRVEHVVEMLVAADLVAQLLDLRSGVGHSRNYIEPLTQIKLEWGTRLDGTVRFAAISICHSAPKSIGSMLGSAPSPASSRCSSSGG